MNTQHSNGRQVSAPEIAATKCKRERKQNPLHWTERAALSINDVIEITGLSRAFINKEIKAGRLETVKKGGRTLIPVNQAWFDAFRVGR